MGANDSAPIVDNVPCWAEDEVTGQYSCEVQDLVLAYAVSQHGAPDSGDLSLTVASMAQFNRANLGGLPANVGYTLLGANADLNQDDVIEANEYGNIADEEVLAKLSPFLQNLAINASYKFLQRVQSVDVIELNGPRGPEQFASFVQSPNAFYGDTDDYFASSNDILVPSRSATTYNLTSWSANRIVLQGGSQLGTNHASMGSAAVAQIVWTSSIQPYEQQIGDFYDYFP